MIGYKAFNNDMTCRGFQYSIGNTYEITETPKICSRGFHFCRTVEDVFQYYPFNKDTKICKIEAYNKIDTRDDIKFCTNKIKIGEEINFDNLFQLRYKKEATSNSIQISTIEVGTKIHIKNHTLICVSVQKDQCIFAFDTVVAKLPVYKISSFIHNLDNFKDWLTPEWLDNIEEIFIPNEYEVFGSYFWGIPENESLLPFTYYKYTQNRIKIMNRHPVTWWLSSVVPASNSTNRSYYSGVNYFCDPRYYDSTRTCGVAPHFIITKTH